MPAATRVLLVDDHALVRAGIRRLLQDDAALEVVGELGSGQELLAWLAHDSTDVVVLDIAMPGRPFLDLLRAVRVDYPASRILVLTAHAEEEYAIACLRAGAAGFLTKDRTSDELAAAIRTVAQGRRYITPTLAGALLDAMEVGAGRPAHETLSQREFEVLVMLGQGLSVKRIAHRLDLSGKTVSTYRSRLLEKLGVDSTANLIRYAVEHGLTKPSGPESRTH